MAQSGNVNVESFSNRSLWQLINATGVIRPKELVKKELKRNEKKILDGLSYFKKPVHEEGAQLKDKNLTAARKQIIAKISKFLGLDELQSLELFYSYIANDYRGSQKNLKEILSNERHIQALIYKIRDYYFTERSYLLQCLKVVLNFWQDDKHPFKDELSQVLAALAPNDRLLEKLIEQVNMCLEAPLPTWETNSVLMTDKQAQIWVYQNLKEQCEILEILMIYLKDFEVSIDQAVRFLEQFRRHGFGRRQIYKHVLEETHDPLIKRIGYLEVLIMLEVLDLETVFASSNIGSFDTHFILKDTESFKRIDQGMQMLGAEPCHGPLLLSWAAVRRLYPEGSDDGLTRKYGNKALRLNVFDTILDILSTEPFSCKTSFVFPVTHYILYTLFVSVMTAFDESTLGRDNRDLQVLHKVISQLLKQEFAAEDVWQRGLTEGLGSVFHSALLKFPLDFTSLLQFSTALAASGPESAKRVFEIWKSLPRYTEYLDRNSSMDLNPTNDPTVWQLARNKIPYPGRSFKIDAGTSGQILSTQGRRDESPAIQWDVTFNGWELITCEIEELLQQISHGAGSVSLSQVAKVTVITEFCKSVLDSYPEAIQELEDIIDCLYPILHRFTRFNPLPMELLSACVECLTCVAKTNPKQVWHNMKQTGLLPYLTENVDNLAEVLSGQGLSSGSYGSLLAGYECTQGHYPLTTALLDFISTFLQPFFKEERENELMAPVLYILREVFPVFQKWKYYNYSKREAIGQSCLNIFHKILTFIYVNRKKPVTQKRPQLQEVCVYSLLFTEAGRALLEIIATGPETIELALAQQGSITDEGTGTELIQLILMSFSVLNRLMLLKSPDLPMSPVEGALSSQPAGRQTQHIVSIIAQYVYHRHNPRLPTLAILLLKRLAMVSKMSILACLGGDAESIRDMFLTRLQAKTEDMHLKVVILELLAVCVDTQLGLIEIFLNVHPVVSSSSQQTDSSTSSSGAAKKDLSFDKSSCLQTVLDLMDVKKQGSYLCPPDLFCACLDFIHSLWAGLRETAMSVLRARDGFWQSVCAPLLKDLQTIDQVEETLQYVKDCLVSEGEQASTTEENLTDNPTLQLLIAWKNFVMTIASTVVEELQLNDSLKEVLIVDLMEGLKALVCGTNTALKIKIAQVASALLFTLTKTWTSSFSNQSRIIKEMEDCLKQTLSNSETLIPPVQIGLLGSMASILQFSRTGTSVVLGTDAMNMILPTTCSVLLQSSRELPQPQELSSQSTDMSSIDVRLKLQMVTCCLLEELILQCSRSDIWLPVIQEHLILPTLLASIEMFIKNQQGLHYVHTVMLLLLTIAKTEKGAEALAMSGLTQRTCLSIMSLYKDEDFFHKSALKPSSMRGTRTEQVTWHSVYCLCIDLYAKVLGALKYSFLEDALNFIGVHQERLQKCLELSRISLSTTSLQEAEKTCDFIYQMSHFIREWRLHLCDSLNKLQLSMLYMSQTFIAFLMRPRYLQYVIEQQQLQRSVPPHRRISSNSPKQPRLQQQSSTEDIDTPSHHLVNVQQRMLVILGRSLSSLRHFTPDLCEIMYDQSIDFSEYEPFLVMGFSGPSTDQDSVPSFGTLTSCVRDVCVRFLGKIEPRGSMSPQRSAELNNVQNISKNLVIFVMENALYIIMSQAMRYLRDPTLPPSDKQLLKRELGTEMNYFLMELQRYLKRGPPTSPSSSRLPSPRGSHMLGRSISQTAFASGPETEFFKFVQEFVSQVLK